ncbi:MAG: serine hydroxymethyltransferase, partial [Candidatus Ranarchaeia archaeon]
MVDPIQTLKKGNYEATESYYHDLTPEEAYENIFENIKKHHSWMRASINLIASANVVSAGVREAIVTDFAHRYAEGWPGERVYAGCTYIDQVEVLCSTLAKRLFKAEFADVRPTSGVTANLVVYSAFTSPNDRMLALSIPNGGHISMARAHTWGTAGKVHGLKVSYFPFDQEKLTIDPDLTRTHLKKLEQQGKPIKLFMIGASVFLFPAPVKELVELAKEYNAHVNYDASHVAGLIAGKQFQDPIRDGVDSMTFSTHKTFFGPQHGMILAKKEHGNIIKKGTFPALTSNHHLHNVAGLAVSICEMEKFGQKYATQVVKNAKALGEALHQNGFNVLGEDRGF